MNICTKLLPLDLGDFDLEWAIDEVESSGQVIVAVTSKVDPSGKPLVRLVGQAPVLLSMLQDGWEMTLDEAQAYLEQ